jgi:hypothetical protein
MLPPTAPASNFTSLSLPLSLLRRRRRPPENQCLFLLSPMLLFKAFKSRAPSVLFSTTQMMHEQLMIIGFSNVRLLRSNRNND